MEYKVLGALCGGTAAQADNTYVNDMVINDTANTISLRRNDGFVITRNLPPQPVIPPFPPTKTLCELMGEMTNNATSVIDGMRVPCIAADGTCYMLPVSLLVPKPNTPQTPAMACFALQADASDNDVFVVDSLIGDNLEWVTNGMLPHEMQVGIMGDNDGTILLSNTPFRSKDNLVSYTTFQRETGADVGAENDRNAYTAGRTLYSPSTNNIIPIFAAAENGSTVQSVSGSDLNADASLQYPTILSYAVQPILHIMRKRDAPLADTIEGCTFGVMTVNNVIPLDSLTGTVNINHVTDVLAMQPNTSSASAALNTGAYVGHKTFHIIDRLSGATDWKPLGGEIVPQLVIYIQVGTTTEFEFKQARTLTTPTTVGGNSIYAEFKFKSNGIVEDVAIDNASNYVRLSAVAAGVGATYDFGWFAAVVTA